MAAIAATTERIRIGSAGIMLPHYAPFKVAEVFRVLDALAPGRIDMGLGRAPGSDGRTAFALNPAANERPEHFPSDVRDLMAWVQDEPLVNGHPFAAVKAFPQGTTSPEVWILGSSDYGAQVAALFGLPYCYAWFFSDGAGGERAIDLYERTYRPSERHPTPHSGLCVWALAAPSMDEAQYHLTSRVLSRINRDRGLLGPLVSPDEAAKALAPHDPARIGKIRKDSFVGTGPEVMDRIVELKERVGVDEMAVVTWTYDEAVRRQSYAELAKAF
jgi:luciferase family oxidoreductase group 1